MARRQLGITELAYFTRESNVSSPCIHLPGDNCTLFLVLDTFVSFFKLPFPSELRGLDLRSRIPREMSRDVIKIVPKAVLIASEVWTADCPQSHEEIQMKPQKGLLSP